MRAAEARRGRGARYVEEVEVHSVGGHCSVRREQLGNGLGEGAVVLLVDGA